MGSRGPGQTGPLFFPCNERYMFKSGDEITTIDGRRGIILSAPENGKTAFLVLLYGYGRSFLYAHQLVHAVKPQLTIGS